MSKNKSRNSRKKKKAKRQQVKLPQPKSKELPSIEQTTVESLLASTGNWPEKILMDIGIEIHKGRKSTPISQEDAPDATYDERIGIHYTPIDIVSYGYCIKAQPRRIGTDEVAAYAKSSCKRCYGVGKWKVTKTATVGKDGLGKKILNDVEYELTCECAVRIFKQKNKHFVIDSQLGEFIALDKLEIVKAPPDEMPKVPKPGIDNKLQGPNSVSELPETSTE